MLGTLDINDVWNIHVVDINTGWVKEFAQLIKESHDLVYFNQHNKLDLVFDKIKPFNTSINELLAPYSGYYTRQAGSEKIVFSNKESYTFFLLNKERAFEEFFKKHKKK